MAWSSSPSPPPGSAPSCRNTVANPSRWGPQVVSVPHGWAVRTGAGLGRYRTGPFCVTLWCLGLEAEKRLKGRVTGCLFSQQHCPFVPRVPCQGRNSTRVPYLRCLIQFHIVPTEDKVILGEATTRDHILVGKATKATPLSSLYLFLSGWRVWVVHEGRRSSLPLLARGRSLSGWALAPQSTWRSPFSLLHTASDATISTFV